MRLILVGVVTLSLGAPFAAYGQNWDGYNQSYDQPYGQESYDEPYYPSDQSYDPFNQQPYGDLPPPPNSPYEANNGLPPPPNSPYEVGADDNMPPPPNDPYGNDYGGQALPPPPTGIIQPQPQPQPQQPAGRYLLEVTNARLTDCQGGGNDETYSYQRLCNSKASCGVSALGATAACDVQLHIQYYCVHSATRERKGLYHHITSYRTPRPQLNCDGI